MVVEKVAYSYKAVNECIKAINGLNNTVNRKSEHPWRCYEVGRVYDLCYEKTACLLFDKDYSPWREYSKAVNNKFTKKELDRLLKRSVHYLKHEIYSILAYMDSGEFNSDV